METEKKEAIFRSESCTAVIEELRRSYCDGRTRPYEWRVKQLQMLQTMLRKEEAEIVRAVHEDLRKPEFEVLIHEINLLMDSCNLAIKKLKSWMKPEKVSTGISTFPSTAEIVPEPLGVVLIISAWNYPILLSLDPVIGAIAAGNAVILKPSEIAPATSSFLAKTIPKYLDGSCIRVIEGGVQETSTLLEHKFDKILYTGNSKVARIIMAAAAKHLTPVVMELGGKCPVVVDSNIELKVAARRIVSGKWGCNNGQTCIAPDYIITLKSFAPKLVDAFIKTIKEFYGDEPLKSKKTSRIVNSKHYNRLVGLLEDAETSDKIVYGGEHENNLNIAPTILLDVPVDALIMKEEIFGPLLPIITVDNLEEGFDFINSRDKPLAAYLFTKDKKLEEKFVSSISAGGVSINETVLHMTNNNLPFGGVGESGMGHYHGKFSFDTFSHKKAVLRRTFVGDVSLRYPPFTPKKQKIMKAILGGDIIGLILALLGRS